MRKFFWILALLLSTSNISQGQTDTIITKDNNILFGSIKSMDKGVVILETSYSDKDFHLEWKGISKIITNTQFLITTADGYRYVGSFQSDSSKYVQIKENNGTEHLVRKKDIVYLNEVERGFVSRLYASIEVGYSFTKAKNLQQITSRSSMGYIGERWAIGASFNYLESTQDSVTPIRRTDGEAFARLFLPRDWYLTAALNFLSNSEQLLDLRSNLKLGMGKYVIHTNKAYWGFSGGAAYNVERFTSEEPERLSWEGFVGTELNLYDIGDLSLLTTIVAYPGITEHDRLRADGQFDAKYDFPLDFFIKLGFSVNYDNQPTEGAVETDYVFQTTLGWEW